MQEVFLYWLKGNAILSCCWLAYRLLFNRLTFFQANRLFLVGSIVAACWIPLLHIPAIYSAAETTANWQLPATITTVTEGAGTTTTFNWSIVILLVWLAGVVVFAGRFLMQLVSLLVLWLGSTPASWRQLVYRRMAGNHQPFSFLGSIFLNPDLHPPEEIAFILQHESVHVRQGHSLDIVLAELTKIICWCNPVSWWLKHDIHLNLEFIADKALLCVGIPKQAYQLSLVKVAGQQALPALGISFSFFKLKPRITMMNKSTTTGLAGKLSYLLIVPMLIGLLLSCSDQAEVSDELAAVKSTNMQDKLALEALPANASYFIDGREVSREELASLSTTQVLTVDVKKVDGESSVYINTQVKPEEDKEIKNELSSFSEALFILEGKEVAHADIMAIAPEKIKSINVMKGDGAVAEYGEKAAKGVVVIELH